jgi:hypothetical protein
MGIGEEGMPILAFLGRDGLYYILGTLITPPPSKVKKILQSCMPLVDVIGGVNTILGPVLRYIEQMLL